MKPIKRVMVAVDFSEYSNPALRYADIFCDNTDARIMLVNVINLKDLYPVQGLLELYSIKPYEDYVNEAENSRALKMTSLIESVGCGNRIEKKIVRIGVPYQEIIAAVKSERSDLLIIGTKGRSNLGDTIIGSTALKLYRRCPAPLLVLRPEILKAYSK